jgi:formylglycine-generating enzyme required for sulfatase activity
MSHTDRVLALALTLLVAPGSVVVRPGGTTVLHATASPRITVEAGSFAMGSTADDLQLARRMCADEMRGGGSLMLELSPRCGARFDNESPQVTVFVPAFALDRTEVTVGDYLGCVRAGACRPTAELRLEREEPRLPVERVTWWEAAAYCRAQGGRLPSEAEWEKAARAFGRRSWPWGGEWQEGRANHGRAERMGPGGTPAGEDENVDDADGFAGRAPVGSFPAGASPLGIVDLAGNVWEWTATPFARDPPQGSTRHDPRGPLTGDERTVRGGSYRSPPSDLRLTRRVGLPPGERLAGVGFRCAHDVGGR